MSGIERVCISVDSTCNLSCRYCYFFRQPDKLPGPNALTSDEIGVILNQVQTYGRHSQTDKKIKVNFVGSGEPLLAWKAIRSAISSLCRSTPDHGLRFYTVTNGLLLSRQVVAEMVDLKVFPSVSIDGPAWLHDRNRVFRNGQGSHHAAMRGIGLLQEGGLPVAINTTLTHDVIQNLDAYFDFVEEQRFDKIIFDRIVDVPPKYSVSSDDFYAALRLIANIKHTRGLDHLEIGNIEAYRRAVSGDPDRVCTMFGSTCGAGFHNIIYMQRDVYPCGRMFGQKKWLLGHYDEPLDVFTARMAALVGNANHDDCVAGPDCLIERESPTYDGLARKEFVDWFALRISDTHR